MIFDKVENAACQSRENSSRVRGSFENWLVRTSSPRLERIRREDDGLGDVALNSGAKLFPKAEFDEGD